MQHVSFLSEEADVNHCLEQGKYSEAVALAQALLTKYKNIGEQAYEEAENDIAEAYRILGCSLHRAGQVEQALSPLMEASERFRSLANTRNDVGAAEMATDTLADIANCMTDLGQIDEAIELYGYAIQHAERRNDRLSAASFKGNLATALMLKGRYKSAIQFHKQALETFTNFGAWHNVAVAWHMIGLLYKRLADYEAAETAFSESLSVERQIDNDLGIAGTCAELGNLYSRKNREEEAILYFGEAIQIFTQHNDKANAGRTYGNLASSLMALDRNQEARSAIIKAIGYIQQFGHAVEPWKAFYLLYNLEQKVGDTSAAKAAYQQSIEAYLSYRRDGGESLSEAQEIFMMVARVIRERNDNLRIRPAQDDLELSSDMKALLSAIQQVLDGCRNPSLSDDPNLHYIDAAELRLLLEGLAM